MVEARLLAEVARCLGRCWGRDMQHGNRQHLHQGAAFGVRRKRGRSDQAIGRSRGGWTTKIHALTDVIGRPFALMLTPGNVSDVAAAPALLERVTGMRYLLGDKGYDADRLGVRYAKQEPLRSSRADETASAQSVMTSSDIATATSLKMPSAASRTSAVSPPATTSSPPTSYQAWRSLPP